MDSRMAKCFVLLMILPFICSGTTPPDSEVTTYVSGTAELRCLFQNPKNYSLQNLLFIWEKKAQKESLVVAELYLGEKKTEHINERYQHRTIDVMANGDLRMSDVTMEDEGVYICYVRRKFDNIEKEQTKECKLNVLANFTVPQIIHNNSLQVVEKDSEETFHCSSANGFPKPFGILWTVSSENGTEGHYTDCAHRPGPSCTIKKHSKTFNVSSEFKVKVKANMSITCKLVAHHNVSSQTLHIGIKNFNETTEPVNPYGHVMYIVPCAILVVICIIACIVCIRNKGKKNRSRPQQMDEGENLRRVTTSHDETQEPDETEGFMKQKADANGS